jgi:hypothetical protein
MLYLQIHLYMLLTLNKKYLLIKLQREVTQEWTHTYLHYTNYIKIKIPTYKKHTLQYIYTKLRKL